MRSSRYARYWRPKLDFERPPVEKPTNPNKFLDGIPEILWDTPLSKLDGNTPREAAQHVALSGCWKCRDGLRHIKEAHQ